MGSSAAAEERGTRRRLGLLEPGARVWVNLPGIGYVGVGEVVESEVPIDDFRARDGDKDVPIIQMPLKIATLNKAANDPDHAEHLVRIKWLKTVPQADAVKEKGFFGNQNTVAQPKVAKWQHTVNRLKQRWGIE